MGAEVTFTLLDKCPLALTEDEVERTCELVLAEEGVERLCMVSLTVTDDDGMRELNQEWRGIDAATDVLSLECERPDDPDLAPGEPCELGDIVLAPGYIARQAARLGVSAESETRLLLVHGLLHLLGYDHLVEEEAVVMEAREDELCAMLAGSPVRHVEVTRHEDEVRA